MRKGVSEFTVKARRVERFVEGVGRECPDGRAQHATAQGPPKKEGRKFRKNAGEKNETTSYGSARTGHSVRIR